MRATHLGIGASLAFVIAGVVGCVSERTSGPSTDLAACTASLPSAAFGSTIVIIRDFQFTPAQVHVRAGTKVTWVNCGPAGTDSHTSTADAGAWNSPLLVPGATFTQSFATVGVFPYHCVPHPGMLGAVTVE
jgi:plastocyanin